VKVYLELRERGVKALLMRPRDLDVALPDTYTFQGLEEVASFFTEGGLFVSNDSGMAHFAARCGLRPLTLFRDTDPVVWGPRNAFILSCGHGWPTAEEVLDVIASVMPVDTGAVSTL